MNTPGDHDAVTRAALAAGLGDRVALGDFVRATEGDVRRFISHLTNADADDLSQETYLRAIDALPRFEGRSSARTWLLTIARRVVADQVRREIARPQVVRPDSFFERPLAADDFALVEARQLMTRMDDERREAFVLTQLLGFSYAEAADVCEVPVGTIRSRVSRARADLVALWGTEADAREEYRARGTG